jgi:hypothetical protein
MSAGILLALAALGSSSPAPEPALQPRHSPEAIIAEWVRQSSTPKPRISVSLDAESPYQRGDDAHVYLISEVDAYVTVVRIDTDGRLRLLFPLDPWEDNWVRGGQRVEVLSRKKGTAFKISDYAGVGYVFAIASPDPFDFQAITRGDHWDYRTVADDGRVRGDPYVAIGDLADKITPGGEYDYDVAEYYVEQHYDYPRFACYDCHSYTHYTLWNPYTTYCTSFRIVIYDDWYYYPYRYYPYYPAYYPYYRPYPGYGAYYRPYRPGPRYEFKDRGPGQDYVSRVDYRQREDQVNRRPTSSGQEFRGRGTVPAPTVDRQRGQGPGAGPSTGQSDPRRRVAPQSAGQTGGAAGPTAGQPQRLPQGEARPPRTEPRTSGGQSGDRGASGGGRATPGGQSSSPDQSGWGRRPTRGGSDGGTGGGRAAPGGQTSSPDQSGWGRRPSRGDSEQGNRGTSSARPGTTREPGGAVGSRGGAPPPRTQAAPSRGGGTPSRAASPGRASGKSGGGSDRGSSQPQLRRRQP